MPERLWQKARNYNVGPDQLIVVTTGGGNTLTEGITHYVLFGSSFGAELTQNNIDLIGKSPELIKAFCTVLSSNIAPGQKVPGIGKPSTHFLQTKRP